MNVKTSLRYIFTTLTFFTLFVVSGCSKDQSGASMSPDAYKKAAGGSALTPEQHAAMMAAIANQQSTLAAQQAKDAATQHVPSNISNQGNK